MNIDKLFKIIFGIIGFCFLPITILYFFPNEWYLVRDTFIFNFLIGFIFYNVIGEDKTPTTKESKR